MQGFPGLSGRTAGRIGAILLVLPACGCALIDQTTFGARPVAPAPDQLSMALRSNGTVPLVTIRYDGAEFTYDDALATAIEAARARKADASFDIVTAVPAKGTPGEQARTIEQGQGDAAEVMSKMADDGVTPDRIHLSARTDPTITAREVRVYVR